MSVIVYTEDEPQEIDNLETFSKKYQVIHAAGGVVQNDDRNVLLIFRRGKWDLPKGKIENNEPLELGAEREVKEETGLTNLMLRKPLNITYHTYIEKGKDILKETHWYLFDAPGSQPLAPQTDEDINEVIWVSKEKVENYKRNTYALIKDVLKTAGF